MINYYRDKLFQKITHIIYFGNLDYYKTCNKYELDMFLEILGVDDKKYIRLAISIKRIIKYENEKKSQNT